MESYKIAVLLLLATTCVKAGLKTYKNITPAYMQDLEPTFMCLSKEVNESYGLVLSHQKADVEPYETNLDCLFTIHTTRDKRINLRFEYFDLERNYNMETGRCEESGDRFEIYESDGIFWIKNGNIQPDETICGGTGKFPEDYQSLTSTITVRLLTDGNRSNNKGLQFLYVAFTPVEEKTDSCFVCKDESMCIDKSLKCDEIYHCNDNSDEYKSSCEDNIWDDLIERFGFTLVAVVGSAAIVLIIVLLLVCICCCCCCCCRKKDDIQEQKQYQRSPPVPRPAAYPTHNSNASNYSSYSSSVSNHGRPQPSYPSYHPGYPPQQNGHAGYQPVYNPANPTNGRMAYPHKV